MNKLVFKYDNEAKDNSLSICDQVVLSGSSEDIKMNGSLCTDGTFCSDGLSNTINDIYINQVCVGKIVTDPICADISMTWNGDTKLCEKGGTSTYSATETLAGYTISSSTLTSTGEGLIK